MSINLGWSTLDIKDSKWIYGFKSLIDNAPNSLDLNEAIGYHYDIYQHKNGEYLFKYEIIGQESFMAPGFVSASGYFPIPSDVALLLINRKRDSLDLNDKKLSIDNIIKLLNKWIDSIQNVILTKCELGEDLIHDLQEMIICFNAEAYRGCLALAGVVLERTIKFILEENNIQYAQDWMVGKLLKQVYNNEVYVDPSLKNVCNIINTQRIIGVHAKEKVPIPSADQALMVIFAVKDTITRAFKT